MNTCLRPGETLAFSQKSMENAVMKAESTFHIRTIALHEVFVTIRLVKLNAFNPARVLFSSRSKYARRFAMKLLPTPGGALKDKVPLSRPNCENALEQRLLKKEV